MADSTSAATMRPRGPKPANAREIDAVLAGEPPRQRCDRRAAGRRRRAEVAWRGADLKERIEAGQMAPAPAAAPRRRGPSGPGAARRELSGGADVRRSAVRGTGALVAAPPPVRDERDDGADRAPGRPPHLISASVPVVIDEDLHRHLVGLDLEQVVARLHGIAGRLEPLRNLALGDGPPSCGINTSIASLVLAVMPARFRRASSNHQYDCAHRIARLRGR